MAYTRIKYGDHVNESSLSEFIYDKIADVNDLPTSAGSNGKHTCAIGSTAEVIEDGSKYVLNNQNQWVLKDSPQNSSTTPETGEPLTKPKLFTKLFRLPTVANTKLVFEFDVTGYEFSVANFTDGDIYVAYTSDAAVKEPWLIPADCASTITIRKGTKLHGTQTVVVSPASTSEKGVQVQCLEWLFGLCQCT